MKLRLCLPVIFAVAVAAVFLACGGGGGKNNAPQEPIVISVSPKTINLMPGAQQKIVATVTGTSDKSVKWSLDGPESGTVDSTGNYTAPMIPGTYRVTATSAADTTKSDSATVTVDSPGTLNYQDPSATGYDFRFIKNAALSTPTHLVLDLVSTGRRDSSAGLAFTLSVGATNVVSWAKVVPSDSMMVQNGTVFNLGTSPIGLKTTVENAVLNAVVAQKGLGSPHALDQGTLARIALDANPAAGPGVVALSTVKFQILTSTGAIINLNPSSVAFGQLSLI
jgi:hypothetical protein